MFDIERLGFEEGEEILPGIVLQADGGVTGNFRVLCDGDHDARASSRRPRSSTRSPPQEIAEPVYADGPRRAVRPAALASRARRSDQPPASWPDDGTRSLIAWP